MKTQCPICGADLETDAWPGTQVECAECGGTFVLQSYEPPKGRYHSIAVAVLVFIACIIGFTVYHSLRTFRYISREVATESTTPQEFDPFESMTVHIEGRSGRGYLYVTGDWACDYTPSKTSNLKNGDVVTIAATSDYYNLTRDSFSYTVTGLDEFLRDPDELSKEQLELMEKTSRHTLENMIADTKLPDSTDTVTLGSRHSIHVLSDNDANVVYDCYNATWESATGITYDILLVAQYVDLITRPQSLMYTYVDYKGPDMTLSYVLIKNGLPDLGYHHVRGYWGYDDFEVSDLINRKQADLRSWIASPVSPD